ncbi:MAG: hypothetical protein M3552_00665 [Planctomycetota bacterium]|nr:hypothetical protein [Planctomycetaceae bacterium]MDQ3329157.1 hypothetical protein [Planctomycetota bacterium]
MKVLFDQGVPVPLRRHFAGTSVETVYERGWSRLTNGELIDQAEQEEFDVFVTTDQKLRYQQNLAGRSIAIVVLLSTSWPRIRQHIDDVVSAAAGVMPGDFVEIII